MEIPKYTVAASYLCDFSDCIKGSHHSDLCFGAQRDVLVLSTEQEHMNSYGRLKGMASFRLHHWHNGQIREIQLPPSDSTFFQATPVGENYLCIAACVAAEQQNIHLFNASGHLLHTWDAGYSISDVQFNGGNEIWMAYGDEGIFTGLPDAPSRQGLNCFDIQGNHLFGFLNDVAKDSSNTLKMICDCYALNVTSSRDTWLCYYTEFPLVHLRDHKVEAIFQPTPEMVGSHSFAICNAQRLYTGGYKNRKQIFWRDEATQHQFEIEVVDEQGKPLVWRWSYGRGADLFLYNETAAWLISLDEINL